MTGWELMTSPATLSWPACELRQARSYDASDPSSADANEVTGQPATYAFGVTRPCSHGAERVAAPAVVADRDYVYFLGASNGGTGTALPVLSAAGAKQPTEYTVVRKS